jgi:hypothetical protein
MIETTRPSTTEAAFQFQTAMPKSVWDGRTGQSGVESLQFETNPFDIGLDSRNCFDWFRSRNSFHLSRKVEQQWQSCQR